MSQQRNEPEPNGLDDRFADWVDGRLDTQARRELEAELVRDPELRRQAEEYRATVDLLRQHLAEPSADEEPPHDLVTGVLQRVRRVRPPLFRLVPLLASLSAAAALVLVLFLINQPPGPRSGPPADHYERRDLARHEFGHAGKHPGKEEDKAAVAEPSRGKKAADRDGEVARARAPSATRQNKAAEQAEQEVLEVREQMRKGQRAVEDTDKDMAKVPAAPTAPAEPGGTGGGEQAASPRGKAGKAGRRYRDIATAQAAQMEELRRIATQVFTLEEQEDELDERRAVQKKSDADKKLGRPEDAKDVSQLPLVVVQLGKPPKLGQGPDTGVRLRAEGGKAATRETPETKDRVARVEHQQQRQLAQGFLNYLQQQEKTWGVGNQILRQARVVDVTGSVVQLKRVSPPAPEAAPQAGAGAVGPTMLEPGDQLFLVSGSSQEVEGLFQQLKAFLGKSQQGVVVQELRQAPFSREVADPEDRRVERGRAAAPAMQFYLVLREAPGAAPAKQLPRGRR